MQACLRNTDPVLRQTRMLRATMGLCVEVSDELLEVVPQLTALEVVSGARAPRDEAMLPMTGVARRDGEQLAFQPAVPLRASTDRRDRSTRPMDHVWRH